MYLITDLIKRGKKLSYLLRHDRNYAFDEHGWREVSDLVANHGFTIEELHEIVPANNKQRYEFFVNISDSNDYTESTKGYSDFF